MQQQTRNVKHPSLEYKREHGPMDTLISDFCPLGVREKTSLEAHLLGSPTPSKVWPILPPNSSSHPISLCLLSALIPLACLCPLPLHLVTCHSLCLEPSTERCLGGSKKEDQGPILEPQFPPRGPPLIPQCI